MDSLSLKLGRKETLQNWAGAQEPWLKIRNCTSGRQEGVDDPPLPRSLHRMEYRPTAQTQLTWKAVHPYLYIRFYLDLFEKGLKMTYKQTAGYSFIMRSGRSG